MKNTFSLTAFFVLFIITVSTAQDIHFSQYNFSALTLNPALTAAYKDLQATIQHKEQWRTQNAFRTSAATFEFKLGQPNWKKIDNKPGAFKKKFMKGLALGVNVFSDNAGDGNMKQTQANLSVAYHALLNKQNTLSAGIMAGVAQRSFSPEGLRWNNQYAGGSYNSAAITGENFSNRSFVYADYAAGLLWSYGNGTSYLSSNDQQHINAGFSIAHLSKPSYSFVSNASERLNWKYTFHANSLFGIKNTKYSIGPSILFMQQGAVSEFTSGVAVKYKFKEESKYTGMIKGSAISFGCYYRNKDAIIPYFLIEIDKYAMGISYDTNISGLASATSGRGGFEISLRFNTPSPFLYQTKSSF